MAALVARLQRECGSGSKFAPYHYNKIISSPNQTRRAVVRKQFIVAVLAGLALSGCSTTPSDNDQTDSGQTTTYRTGDLPFSYPESLLTGYNSTECLKWSDSDIVATDKLFLFDAAGMGAKRSQSLALRLDKEIAKLSTSMDWAAYRWVNSLPVINEPNGAALFADSLITLDRGIGTARLNIAEVNESPGLFDSMILGQSTEKVDVLQYVLPGFTPQRDWRAPAHYAYKHFLKLPRKERVEAVRRFNRLSEFHVSTDPFDILPGRILVCVHREAGKDGNAEGHDLGVNIRLGATDQEVRSALVASYQAVRTQSYGQLESLVPEWFLTGQRVFHGGGRIATVEEGMFNSPINSHGTSYDKKPDNYPALSGLAYRYLGEANAMSLIASLLDAVRYRDMPDVGRNERQQMRYFTEAFDDRMKGLDGGPLTVRGFDYGWNGFIGTLE